MLKFVKYMKKRNCTLNSNLHGHPQALSADIEEMLTNRMSLMNKSGFGLSKTKVLDVVQIYLIENQIKW